MNVDIFTNSIICGDCEQVLKNSPTEKFNLIFTSPPYADIANKYKNGATGVPANEYCNWFIPKIKEFHRTLNNKGSFILNIDDKVENGFRHPYVYELVHRITNETGFKLFERFQWNKGKGMGVPNRFRNTVEYIFWFAKEKGFTFNLDEMRTPYDKVSLARMKNPIKKRFVRTEENQDLCQYKEWIPHPRGAVPSTLINIGSESKRVSNTHFAVFPVKLADYFIRGGSNPGDLILDPFGGTMTTCVAAKKIGRNYCGIDCDAHYCEEGKLRLETMSP